MRGSTPSERRCDRCGDPAAHTDGHDDYCGDCACWIGANLQGEAAAAMHAIGFAIALARSAQLSDDQIRGALEEMLKPETEDCGDYPICWGQLPTERKGDRWLGTVVPLSAFPGGDA